MAFTKIKRPIRYSCLLAVGVKTQSNQVNNSPTHSLENITEFASQLMVFVNGSLKPVKDMLTWSGNEVFDAILNYCDIGNNCLIVCNHSLVLLGASDFVHHLDNGSIAICDNKVNADDYAIKDVDNLDAKQFIASMPPTIVGCWNNVSGGRFTLVDIANYGPKYLVEVWENLSDEEKKLIPNYAELGVSEDSADTCCALIARYMQEWYKIVSTFKLGGIALTYAGQGMRAYRYKFCSNEIVTHRNDNARILERACYVGGRCEVRYQGWYHGKTYLLDIRSLYPALGKTKEFPCELQDFQEHPTKETIDDWLQTSCVLAYCHIDTPEPAYPKRIGSATIFPVGRFNAFLCGEEFKDAWNNGYITTVYRAASYRTGSVLKSYSEYMLDARSRVKQACNSLGELCIKRITNGTWGQFGKNTNVWILDETIKPDSPYGGFIKRNERTGSEDQYRIINWQVSKLTSSLWTDNTFTPIAAIINSYSRHMIYRHALLAGMRNVLYFSIDGMIVTQEGLDRLSWLVSPHYQDYGTYRISESSQDCYIKDVGVYRIGNKVAYQGCPERDTKTYKGFWSVTGSKQLGSNSTQVDSTKVHRIESSITRRKLLGYDDNKPGFFTGLTVLDESPLVGSSCNPAYSQTGFHSGEWQR